MNRAGVWSPCSGRPGVITLTMEDLRRQGQQGLLGTQMTVAVVEKTKPSGKGTFKHYRLPAQIEVNAANVEREELEGAFEGLPFGVPSEPLPKPGALGIRIVLYGCKRWEEMFVPRQLVALAAFAKHTRDAIALLKESQGVEAAQAIGAMLGIVFGRFVDYMSVMCLWEPDNGEVKHTFARYAFPITWDFAEANPLTLSDRFYSGGIQVASRVLDHLLKATAGNPFRPNVFCGSSLCTEFGVQDVIVTDPPYYAAIPYSDLMDYFLIWQKRIFVGAIQDRAFTEAFSRELGPKWDDSKNDGELVQDESRHGGNKELAKRAYEDGMAKAFGRCLIQLNEHGRLVIVFANKSVDAWETLVGALIQSGADVTASWPIQTEMPNRK